MSSSFPRPHTSASATTGEQDQGLLTVKEAAALLKVSTATIKRYLKSGRLPGYQVGPRAIRIRREDLAQVMHPTETQEVKMKQEHGRITFPKPTPEELARRKAIATEIWEIRQRTDIRPLTTADLVRQARSERTWYGEDH
jgi:excisionase family DNA binding protein